MLTSPDDAPGNDGWPSVSVRPLRQLSASPNLPLLHLLKPGPYRAMMFDVMWPHSASIMKSSLPRMAPPAEDIEHIAGEMLAPGRRSTPIGNASDS